MVRPTQIISVLWLSLISALFCWNVAAMRENHRELALQTARAFFSQIVLGRAWNAGHGGVYVPVTDRTQPNIFLDDPRRDLSTDEGVLLTKVNPAFMTRQIAEIAETQNGVKFHITSLHPIRPENRATDQEAKWLSLFKQGTPEAGSFYPEGDSMVFQYMAPLHTEANCLKCHARHGTKKGDILGGISVTLPFFSPPDYTGLIAGYGGAALAGLVLIFSASHLLESKNKKLLQSNGKLEEEVKARKETEILQEQLIVDLQGALEKVKTLEGILPLCSHCKKIRKQGGDPDRQEDWSDLEEYVHTNTDAEFSHSVCPACLTRFYSHIRDSMDGG